MREAFGRLEDFRWVHESSEPDPAIVSLLEQGLGLTEEASNEFYGRMLEMYTRTWDTPEPMNPKRATHITPLGAYVALIAAQLDSHVGALRRAA